MVCTKKFLFWINGPKNELSSSLWIGSKNFFEILQNERAHRYMKILSVVFQGKISVGAI